MHCAFPDTDAPGSTFAMRRIPSNVVKDTVPDVDGMHVHARKKKHYILCVSCSCVRPFRRTPTLSFLNGRRLVISLPLSHQMPNLETCVIVKQCAKFSVLFSSTSHRTIDCLLCQRKHDDGGLHFIDFVYIPTSRAERSAIFLNHRSKFYGKVT